jgi:regulator of protease activity HflC (stomatin/prohibitin superfamily)
VQSVPPRQLQDVFARVTEARQNQSKQMNVAYDYRDKTLLNAAAQASAITTQAAAASTNYVVAIQADANAFTNSLTAFEKNRYLFAQQKVAETMALVLTNVAEKKFIPTHADGKPIEVRLMLNNEPPEQKSAPMGP